MGRFIVLLAVLVVLVGTHAFAYSLGLRRDSRATRTRAGTRQVTDVVRAARRAVAADPSMPQDAALRRQELALALDEYDAARAELDG